MNGDALVDTLERQYLAADADGLRETTTGLDSGGRREARAWWEEASQRTWPDPSDDTRTSTTLRGVAEATVLLGLLTPTQAFAGLRLVWWRLNRSDEILDSVAAAVLARDPAWRAELVRMTGGLRHRPGRWQPSEQVVYRMVRAVSDRDGIPVPWNDLLVHGWLADTREPTSWEYPVPPVDPEAVLSRIRADGRYAAAAPRVLSLPRLSDFPWIAPAIATLVSTGELDRAEIVATCLTALDSPGRATDQKIVAELLRLLDVHGDDVIGGLPRLQQILATCHGFVTSRLLPLAGELAQTTDDVAELAATIGTRPEKQQRADLLRMLTSTAFRRRVGDEAVLSGLAILAESPDAAIATKAGAAIAGLGRTVEAAPTGPIHGLWERLPPAQERWPNDPFHELSTFDDNAVAVVRRTAQPSRREGLPAFYEPVALSILVRWSFVAGPDAARAAIVAKGPLSDWRPETALGHVLPDWLATEVPDPMAGQALFPVRLARESLLRAGRVPFLLSTSNRPDATLDLEVLVDRLRRSAAIGFAPLDLLQAILRLGPVAPERAAELDGLPVVVPDPLGPTSTHIPDATAYLRDLIASGRTVRAPITVQRMREEGWLPSVGPDIEVPGWHAPIPTQPPDEFWLAGLPVDPAEFGVTLDDLTGSPGSEVQSATFWHAFPWSADLRVRAKGLWRPAFGWWDPPHPSRNGTRVAAGVAVHDALLREYGNDERECRETAVTTTLAWISEGQYTPEPALAAACGRLALDRINLARVAGAWDQVFNLGGLAAAWPVALGVAALAVERERKPRGLADLLRLLVTYAPEVPAAARQPVPHPIRALAEQKGSTKSHAEARLLVAALEAP